MEKIILILDLDGVLITNPIWRADELDTDGYSLFNQKCIENLNTLLSIVEMDTWLSSTRRTTKTIKEFNAIFQNRNIKNEIIGFLPLYATAENRKEEIEFFIQEKKITEFLIIDDDKSLHELNIQLKQQLILTQFMKGFNQEKLEEAVQKLEELINTQSKR